MTDDQMAGARRTRPSADGDGHGDGADDGRLSRRRAVWLGAASVPAVWAAPQIISTPAAAAATEPPPMPTLVAVSGVGVAYRSMDDGATWSPAVVVDPSTALQTVAANGSTFVAAGNSLVAHRSTDGGLTWSALPFGRSRSVTANGSTFLAVSSVPNGSVYRSTDDGATWSPPIAVAPFGLTVIAGDGTHVIAGTSQGRVHLSGDGGLTWSAAITIESGIAFTAITRTPTAFLLGSSQGVRRSLDNGATWSSPTGPLSVNGLAANGFVVVAAQATGEMRRSTDGGLTWGPGTDLNPGQQANAVASRGSTFVAAAGDRIFVSVNDGLTWSNVANLISVSAFAFGT